jgi:hypothetical protein
MKLRKIRWAEHTARAQKIQEYFGGTEPAGNKPLGGHSHRWDDNINIDLQSFI